MKKSRNSVQTKVNEYVLSEYEEAMNEYNDRGAFKSVHKLYSCQAQIVETENFYILRSYNTCVACYNKRKIEMCDFLRYVYGYTATSAQHITKFRNWVRYRECIDYIMMDELRYYPLKGA